MMFLVKSPFFAGVDLKLVCKLALFKTTSMPRLFTLMTKPFKLANSAVPGILF